ncbi:hypothetical protein PENTCL1PPCAC_16582, partial [Pristionchus entomophagus]
IDWKGISSKFKVYGNMQSYLPSTPSTSAASNSKGGLTVGSLEAEISLYLDQCIRGIDANHEALDFWRINHTKYPRHFSLVNSSVLL